jgi:hypothetical protein
MLFFLEIPKGVRKLLDFLDQDSSGNQMRQRKNID